MTAKPLSILFLEDTPEDAELALAALGEAGYECDSVRVETRSDFLARLDSGEKFDLILSDYDLPTFDGLSALGLVVESKVDIPFILLSGTLGDEKATESLKLGAADYTLKDNLFRLPFIVERALKDAEDRRRRKRVAREIKLQAVALESAANAIVITDVDGAITWVNAAFTALTGYSSEESVGQNPRILKSGKHKDSFYKDLWETVMAGKVWHGEIVNRRKDGTTYIEDQTITPVFNEAGEVTNFTAIKQDVTERRRAEELIRSSEKQVRDILDNIAGFVMLLDTKGIILDVNGTPLDQAGVKRKDVIGKEIGETDAWRYSPVAQRRIRETVRRAAAGEVIAEDFYPMMANNEIATVFSVFAPLRDSRGKIVKVIGSGFDVTERKRAEEELLKSEERYRDLVENAHDIIYSHDLQGNYTSINEAGERITGYSRDEALRMNITDTIAPEFVGTAQEMLASKLRGEESSAYELEILAKNGERISVEVNTKLILQDGQPAGVQGIARDITGRKQMELQLRQAQKLESVGRLAGGIAHDFNNMLTAINGYSDLTLRQLPDGHKLRRNIEEIKKAGERSALLTNQLLAFSRRQLLQPEIIDINEVISDTTALLNRVIGEDVKLVTELDPNVGRVKADKGQLSQIIMNLSVNARDAMPGGGRLTISTGNVRVDSEYVRRDPGLVPELDYVRLSVSDTGTGIKESDRQYIFEPFFTTKAVGKGTGLGLATVYGIVKQSGGGINVITEVQVGTTFEVLFPRVSEERSHPSGEFAAPGNLPIGAETILLVEDEELVRSLLKELLESCGYTVIAAENGEEALAVCEQLCDPVDLLITDVVMPQMGGRELAERLGKILPGLPVLFVSGYTDDALVRESVLDADVNFIQKPFTLEVVSRKVRELLDDRQQAG